MSTPFFSVIVPAYNPGRFLWPALQSVVEQSFGLWELLVIDDGSCPDQAALIENAVQQARERLGEDRVLDASGEERIRFYKQENQGVSITRNFAITQARAPWLAFLDNDDLWKPTMLEQCHRVLTEKPDTVLCHTNFDLIDENGAVSGVGHGGKIDYERFLEGHFSILPCCSVVSKEVVTRLGGFDPLYPHAQDLDLYLKIFNLYEKQTVFVSEALASYRQHASNVSKSYRPLHREIAHILGKHVLCAMSRHDMARVQAARRGLARMKQTHGVLAFNNARTSLKNRRWSDGASHFLYALRFYPAFVVEQCAAFLSRKRAS